jgi:lysyl-tRNA synthetase class 2
MAIRAQGKAGFATLQQGGQRLQIYVRLDAVGEQGFALYKLLDLGDHIGVTGYLFRTRTGELTIHVETLTFLAKAMLALPEKFHGLADVELRYRQRYVDLFANLDAAKSSSSAPKRSRPCASSSTSAATSKSKRP